MPVESRPRVLFNPDTRSPNFFIPGLMVVLCQMMAIMLSAIAIVREKEKGTLEQLFMTPVRAGRADPGQDGAVPRADDRSSSCMIVAADAARSSGCRSTATSSRCWRWRMPFLLTMLGLGLWISTRVQTRDAAMQMAMGTVIPSIFLSGYIFPIDSMPSPFWVLSQLIPTTWMVDASRGVILRGAAGPSSGGMP